MSCARYLGLSSRNSTVDGLADCERRLGLDSVSFSIQGKISNGASVWIHTVKIVLAGLLLPDMSTFRPTEVLLMRLYRWLYYHLVVPCIMISNCEFAYEIRLKWWSIFCNISAYSATQQVDVPKKRIKNNIRGRACQGEWNKSEAVFVCPVSRHCVAMQKPNLSRLGMHLFP